MNAARRTLVSALIVAASVAAIPTKYHYTPGMHENNSIGEFAMNLDV